MVPLVPWGTRRLGDRKPNESFRGHSAALPSPAAKPPGGVSETYQYLVGPTAFHFIVEDGSIELRHGRAENPAVTLTTDEETWADIASGKTTATTAAAEGALSLAGDPHAVTPSGKDLVPQPGASGTFRVWGLMGR